MKRALFIYNPISGNHNIPRRLDHILSKFQQHDILLQPYRLYDTTDEQIISTLKNSQLDFVVISGGDGTLNSIVNLMLKNDIHLPIGIIPSGTCNDFAASIGVPPSLNENLDIILKGNISEVDVGLINEQKYFLSTCAGGMFVGVSFSTHNELKKNFGPFAYYLKALSEVKNMKSFTITVETEKEKVEEEVLLFLILNGKHGGGFPNLIKEADTSDGYMDIVLIKSCSHIELASLFFNALSNDSLHNKNVVLLRTKSCKIAGSEDVVMSFDGEKGDSLPLNVRFIKRVLKVFTRQ